MLGDLVGHHTTGIRLSSMHENQVSPLLCVTLATTTALDHVGLNADAIAQEGVTRT